jgi:DUF218 domain
MRFPALFRRRHVWVPTVWSWLAVAIACGVAGMSAVRGVYPFLAPRAPVGARVLVVEGWMPVEELQQAARACADGHYERVVATGGPIENELEHPDAETYAERARNFLVRLGVPSDAVVAVPAPASAQDRSFLNAVMVREWVARSGLSVDSLDVFSSGVHSRRSWLLYRMAFGPKVRIGIIPATPSTFDPKAWWRTSAGAKEVLGETIGWLWTALFFHPGPPGSPEERWGVTDR